MQIADIFRTPSGAPDRTRLASTVGLFLALLVSSRSVHTQTLVGKGRPNLEDCAAVLTPGRVWHSDMIFSQLDGVPQDPDIGISDGTSDETFPLQRAAHSYMECLGLALDAPKPSDERSARTSLTTRMTIQSHHSPSKTASSSATRKLAAPVKEPRPHVPDCTEPLHAVKSWKVTADFSFTPDAPRKVKTWAISSDLPDTTSGRKSLRHFAQCLGKTLLVSQKPVFK
jgi:hypothetical protein